MPQPYENFRQAGYTYQPFAPGLDPSRPTGFEGLPGMGMGGLPGMAMQFFAIPQLQKLVNEAGYVPLGMEHDRNVYDTLRAMRFMQMQQAALNKAAEADKQNIGRTMRGAFELAGVQFGIPQQKFTDDLSSTITQFAPMLMDMFGSDFVEQFGGPKGLSLAMARRFTDYGRYRLDPVTGRMGLSDTTSGKQAGELYTNLFSDQNVAKMQGFRAGQVGELFGQLQLRGMMPTLTDRDRRDLVRELVRVAPEDQKQLLGVVGDVDKLSNSQLDLLAKDDAFAGKIRDFDRGRIEKTLEKYTKVVATMRDIFGDMGRQGAPMAELLQSLELLTGGSLNQLPEDKLAQIARNTYNLAKSSGIPLEAAGVLGQHAAVLGQQMGLEPIYAAHATQGALAFGAAFRVSNINTRPAWGAFSDQATYQADANLRMQASNSTLANRLQVASRIANLVGDNLDPNSDLARMVKAMRENPGSTQWFDSEGKSRNFNMEDADLNKLLLGAKTKDGKAIPIDETIIRNLLNQRFANREFDQREVQETVRSAQAIELDKAFDINTRGTTASGLSTLLRARTDLSAKDAEAVATGALKDGLVKNIYARLRDVNPEEFRLDGGKTAFSRIMRDELASGRYGDRLKELANNKNLTDDDLRFFASQSLGAADAYLDTSGNPNKNVVNWFTLNNSTTLAEKRKIEIANQFTGDMQDLFSGMGAKGGIISGVVGALQNVKGDDPDALKKGLAEAIGAIKREKISGRFAEGVEKLDQRVQGLKIKKEAIDRLPEGAEKAQALALYDAELKELQDNLSTIQGISKQFLDAQDDPTKLKNLIEKGTPQPEVIDPGMAKPKTGGPVLEKRGFGGGVTSGRPVTPAVPKDRSWFDPPEDGAVPEKVSQLRTITDNALAKAEKDGPVEVKGHLTGTFKLEGNSIDMVGEAGGSRQFLAGGSANV